MNHTEQQQRTEQHVQALLAYQAETGAFYQPASRQVRVLADYIVANERQVQYFERLKQRAEMQRFSPSCIDVTSKYFDPIKAIIYLNKIDKAEALWLAFLVIHTGDSARSNWQYLKQLYGNHDDNRGQGQALTWHNISQNPALIDTWIDNSLSKDSIKDSRFKFGKHRKYESVKQMGAVMQSYQDWLTEMGGIDGLLAIDAISKHSVSPVRQTDSTMQRFAALYRRLRIFRFGRLAKFEWLSLLGYTGVLDIKADHCYLTEATGPKRGAKLLFGMRRDSDLERLAIDVADALAVDYAIFEASLCHWQASPDYYISH